MKDIYMIIWGLHRKRMEDSFDLFNTTAVVGIRFFDSVFAPLDARIDELRPRISLGRSIMIFLNFQCLDIMNMDWI
jgi:hypothetical protein